MISLGRHIGQLFSHKIQCTGLGMIKGLLLVTEFPWGFTLIGTVIPSEKEYWITVSGVVVPRGSKTQQYYYQLP